MNNVLGSGKLDVFNDLKQHFAVEDAASHISLLTDTKKVQRRESKIAGNDDVLNTLEQLNMPEFDNKTDKKDKDKKRRKDVKSERQKANANVLEKYVKGLRVKEIRPLHLDAMNTGSLKDFYR